MSHSWRGFNSLSMLGNTFQADALQPERRMSENWPLQQIIEQLGLTGKTRVFQEGSQWLFREFNNLTSLISSHELNKLVESTALKITGGCGTGMWLIIRKTVTKQKVLYLSHMHDYKLIILTVLLVSVNVTRMWNSSFHSYEHKFRAQCDPMPG